MGYMGGKTRIAKQLAEVIDRVRAPGQLVWDAFCGGLSCTRALRVNGPVWSTDANAALISMYTAFQAGWQPPVDVDREMWRAAKALPDLDPMKAFCAIGNGYGGDWAGGYVHGRKQVSGKYDTMAGSMRASLKASVLPTSCFAVVDFLSVEPRPTAALLYLDPPYAGTTQYAGVPHFDHERFVERVRGWAEHAHVFVSEYAFPIGECVWERKSPGGCGLAKPDAVERLYHLHPGTK